MTFVAPYALSAVSAPQTLRQTGAMRADYVLVGGGYGGLLTALELLSNGADVIVLEATQIGTGGSGRNHGQCIPIFGYSSAPWVPEKGRQLLRDAGARVFDLIRENGLTCEAVQNGTLTAAYDARTLRMTQAAQARHHQMGKSAGYLGPDEVAHLTGTQAFVGGWVHPDGGHLNPLSYVRELARLVMARGGRVFTDSPMTGLHRDGTGWRVQTPMGEVATRAVGLTTDAYAQAGVPQRAGQGCFPLTCYAIASRPLTPQERRQVMPGGMNLGDTHRDPMFFRIDTHGRIITGGLVEPRRGRDFAYTSRFMTRRLGALYPVLRDLTWDHMWTGRIGMALDQHPFIQRLDDGLYVLSGWSGRGVPTSSALSVCFARTLESERDGAQYWPLSTPRRVYAGAVLGQMVQLTRGPFNQLRDRFGL